MNNKVREILNGLLIILVVIELFCASNFLFIADSS